MRRLAKELQALGFEVLQPAQAQTIRSLQALTRKSDVLATIERELNQAMARQGIAATLEVSARARARARRATRDARRSLGPLGALRLRGERRGDEIDKKLIVETRVGARAVELPAPEPQHTTSAERRCGKAFRFRGVVDL